MKKAKQLGRLAATLSLEWCCAEQFYVLACALRGVLPNPWIIGITLALSIWAFWRIGYLK